MRKPASHPQESALSDPLNWQVIICEAGCFDFLLPGITRAVDEVLRRQPALDSLLGAGVRAELAGLCLGRLRLLYERPILHAALERMRQDGGLPSSADDLNPLALRAAAEAVREDLLADGGTDLEAGAPLAREYEAAIVRNYVNALSEMFGRLLQKRTGISSQLLNGNPFEHILGVADAGGDMHRHGRSALRIQTEAGTFYYKPRPWGLDALLEELVDCWFPGCVVVPHFVRGDDYSFAAELATPASLDEEGLGEYWYHLGALAALFHGVGSRDMTEDNILCAGERPAVVDTEPLVAGGIVGLTKGCAELQPSVLDSSLLPSPAGNTRRSPLTTDNESGSCLPKVEGTARTIAGFEQAFMDGFAVGYRRLLQTRGQIAELLHQARDVPYRKVLLNTWTYVRARAGLFSAAGLKNASWQERVVRGLWNRYGGPPAERRLALARADVAALVEGDIPYYSALIGELTLEGADPCSAIEGVLAESALELACERLNMLDEAELRYELEVIKSALGCC